MFVSAIVLAAGWGKRLALRTPKPLIRLLSKPILIYSLLRLSKHPRINEIILVVNDTNQRSIAIQVKKYRIGKIRAVVLGGKRRQDSVAAGLRAVSRRADTVLVHDAARPFLDARLVSVLIAEAKKTGAAIPGVAVKATVKAVTRRRGRIFVEETLKRDRLFEIQTPQVFKKQLLEEAFARFGRLDATDDSMLIEKLGVRVSIVEGSYDNIKITTAEDLEIAKAIGRKRTLL